MGIESEQLVFDYLSKVGDLAHSRRMSPVDRARLVAEVRGDIDRRRAAAGGAPSPAAVKKILGRLGSPEDVVAQAATGVPVHRTEADEADGTASGGERATTRRLPRPRRLSVLPEAQVPRQAKSAPTPEAGPAAGAASPHLAGQDELGPEESDPHWWENDPSPYGPPPLADGMNVAGFVGGVELPEMLPDGERPPAPAPPGPGGPAAAGGPGGSAAAGGETVGRTTLRKGRPLPPPPPSTAATGSQAADPAAAGAPAGAVEKDEDTAPGPAPRRLVRDLLRRRREADGRRAGGFVELLAVGALAAGAALGQLFALGLGWVLAYWSPRLGRGEAKAAAMGVPGTVAAAGLLWLWGRMTGRWGDPVPEGGIGTALTELLPVVLRVAAVASAVFLLWRARRPAR